MSETYMPNSKRKQEVLKVDLSGYGKKEIEEAIEKIKTAIETSAGKLCILPVKVDLPETKTAFLKADEIDSDPLWYIWRMTAGVDYHEFWWGWYGWDAFGWWEGENPFKDLEAWNNFNWDITYLKSLDPKGEEKSYAEPQGERAYFVVKDMDKAIDALEKYATSFALNCKGDTLQLLAWNKENPDFKACLMMKYDWEYWCNFYFGHDAYGDFGWDLLECSYGIDSPDPLFKDGKLVFGGEFSKTPEEFIYDMATLEDPTREY
jgi:hypothetical protein